MCAFVPLVLTLTASAGLYGRNLCDELPRVGDCEPRLQFSGHDHGTVLFPVIAVSQSRWQQVPLYDTLGVDASKFILQQVRRVYFVFLLLLAEQTEAAIVFVGERQV